MSKEDDCIDPEDGKRFSVAEHLMRKDPEEGFPNDWTREQKIRFMLWEGRYGERQEKVRKEMDLDRARIIKKAMEKYARLSDEELEGLRTEAVNDFLKDLEHIAPADVRLMKTIVDRQKADINEIAQGLDNIRDKFYFDTPGWEKLSKDELRDAFWKWSDEKYPDMPQEIKDKGLDA